MKRKLISSNRHIEFKIIETGEGFHGDEIPARQGEKWLGLFFDREHSRLQFSSVMIQRVHDSIVDDRSSIKTGKSVSVKGPLSPMFLLKDAPGLKPATVPTIFRGLTYQEVYADKTSDLSPNEQLTTLYKDFLRDFELDGTDYQLKVIRALNPEGNRILALVLQTNGTKQVLHTMRTSYEGEYGERDWLGSTGTLFWIGDLDGDQKPDLYLSLFVHENVANHVLMLSTKAKKGQLVGIAGQFWTTGC